MTNGHEQPGSRTPAHLPDLRLRVGELGRRAWIAHCADWLADDEASTLFTAFREGLGWCERAIVAKTPTRERSVMQPRLIAWCGETPYRYSGQTLEPTAWHPVLQTLTERVSAAVGLDMNHVVANLYRSGRDHVRMHADDEHELGKDPLIASISLGETRVFTMETRDKRRKRRTMRLTHGSLLVMGGAMQHTWRHAVLPDDDRPGERINLTFRRLMGPPGWRPDAVS